MKVQKQIEEKINIHFQPSYMEVENESHRHASEAGDESHFRVIIVSNIFNGLSLVKRHQEVYSVLKEEMEKPIHALVLHTYDPIEWSKMQKVPASPPCHKKAN